MRPSPSTDDVLNPLEDWMRSHAHQLADKAVDALMVVIRDAVRVGSCYVQQYSSEVAETWSQKPVRAVRKAA